MIHGEWPDGRTFDGVVTAVTRNGAEFQIDTIGSIREPEVDGG